MRIEYRNPAEHELESAVGAISAAFGAEPQEGDVERHRKTMPLDRVIAAFDEGQAVGTAASFPFELTIPGGTLPTAGVTWVGVLPSHRRRGVMTEAMRRQLDDVRARGEPLAILWASESAIYGRFGYGIAAPAVGLRGDRTGFRFRGDPEPVGRVRLVPLEEALSIVPELYDRIRRATTGFVSRAPEWWEEYKLADYEWMRRGYGPKFCVLVELDGQPEGYALYRIKDNWEEGLPKNELLVLDAFATSVVATRELWRFLFGIDLVARVECWLSDPGLPLFLMVLEPRRLQLRTSDGLWLRLVDVDAALRARSYAADDSVVIDVTDEFCSWNAGRYRVGTGAGRTDDEPDLRLDVADLAGAYLGAFDFERLAAAARVEELTEGMLARASLLFRTPRPPWCPEFF